MKANTKKSVREIGYHVIEDTSTRGISNNKVESNGMKMIFPEIGANPVSEVILIQQKQG